MNHIEWLLDPTSCSIQSHEPRLFVPSYALKQRAEIIMTSISQLGLEKYILFHIYWSISFLFQQHIIHCAAGSCSILTWGTLLWGKSVTRDWLREAHADRQYLFNLRTVIKTCLWVHCESGNKTKGFKRPGEWCSADNKTCKTLLLWQAGSFHTWHLSLAEAFLKPLMYSFFSQKYRRITFSSYWISDYLAELNYYWLNKEPCAIIAVLL